VSSVACKTPKFVTILSFYCLSPFLDFHRVFMLMFNIRQFNMAFLNWRCFNSLSAFLHLFLPFDMHILLYVCSLNMSQLCK